MNLTSLGFALFAAIFVAVYFLAGKLPVPRAQKAVILIANIAVIIKATSIPSLTVIILLAGLVFALGIAIEKAVSSGNKKQASALMYTGVILVVAVLCYFKFFKNTYMLLQDVLNAHEITFMSIAVPVGISYYTLTQIAYILDIYHKKHKASRDFLDFITFITFFPSIVEGPINLYKKASPAILADHSFDPARLTRGIQRIVWGYLKKLVIADRIGIFVTTVIGNDQNGGAIVFIAMLLYSFQIYADFSGGIDVIMGLSHIIGIDLVENFKAPLTSKSITEFWQRWHMSLGEFMEKYIYYPLVLHKRMLKFSKKLPTKYWQQVFAPALGSLIVFIIVGIWHGTGWNYVVYGCFQAFFTTTAVLFGKKYKDLHKKFVKHENAFAVFAALRTFLILSFGRYFIRSANLTSALALFARTFTPGSNGILGDGLLAQGLTAPDMVVMLLGITALIVTDILASKSVNVGEKIASLDIHWRILIIALALLTTAVFGIYGRGFDNASFIYQGV